MTGKSRNSSLRQSEDRAEYLARKKLFDHMITIYGRNPVIEALRDPELQIYRLHLAKSNRDSSTIKELKNLAAKRDIEVVFHSREQLARISRNSKQDQGVACDIYSPGFQPYQQLLDHLGELSCADNPCIIALDSVTNPQNLGMIIRSVTASPAFGLLLPTKGSTAISPLVIKASAGTAFKCNILSCDDLQKSLKEFQKRGFKLCTLTSHNATPISDFSPSEPTVFILGNETHGVSQSIMDMSDCRISIPMANGVESLNVAVTAALVAFNL